MNYLIIDLTHGGVKISISLAKKGEKVFAYDIYNTLKGIDREMLDIYGVEIIRLDDLKKITGKLKVIYPIHLPLTTDEIKKYNPDLEYTFITHHEAVKEILNNWGKDILKVEITGVKGKTSCAFMLKEILIDKNPLILSSLGALLYENKNEIILKKNISITPANIKETIDLANKYANPYCIIEDGKVKNDKLQKYSCGIFENSLGACGIGDVGLLTNIVENYPIAKNKSNASKAKEQIFKCKVVVCQKECLDKYYSHVKHDCINSFSLIDENADLYLTDVEYAMDKTKISVEYSNVKTIKNNVVRGNLTVETFAPGRHHVSNVLGVLLTSLSLEIDLEKIINGIKNYKGIEGRTNKKIIQNSTIIEEINPGINTEAIKESVNMIEDLDDYLICIGGDYGITCEEIDEEKVSSFLDSLNYNIILTGDVGKSIANKMKKEVQYIENYKNVYQIAIENNKNLLFIYRSSYLKLSQR